MRPLPLKGMIAAVAIGVLSCGQAPTWCAAVVEIRNEEDLPIPYGRVSVIESGHEIGNSEFALGVGRVCDLPGKPVEIRVSSPGCMTVTVANVLPSLLETKTLRVVLNGCSHVDGTRFELVFLAKVPPGGTGRVLINGRVVRGALDEFGRLLIRARPSAPVPVLKVHRSGETLPYDSAKDVIVAYEGNDGKRRVVSFDGRPTAEWEQYREFGVR